MRVHMYNTELEKGEEHACGCSFKQRVLCRGICRAKKKESVKEDEEVERRHKDNNKNVKNGT